MCTKYSEVRAKLLNGGDYNSLAHEYCEYALKRAWELIDAETAAEEDELLFWSAIVEYVDLLNPAWSE